MKFLEVLLSVLSIIAIIAAAAFIIIFIVDLFLSINDKNGYQGIFFKNKKKIDKSENVSMTSSNVAEESNRVPYYVDEKPLEEVSNQNEIDYDAAEKEQAELESKNSENAEEVSDEEIIENDDEELNLEQIEEDAKEENIAKILEQYEDIIDAEDEKNEEEENLADFEEASNNVEEMKNDKIREIIDADDDASELEKLINELQESDEKEEAQKELDSVLESKQELEGQIFEADKKLEELTKQKEESEKIIAEKEAEIERLKEELRKSRDEAAEEKPVVIFGNASIEELEARLEVLNERKKANAKELKKVKKEYAPLNTLRRTLEGDKKKLRRREAIVAKQNTLLYGVNNYVDIDDEKAKKLTEEHELLEGLRMSVKNCEELLEKNKDRLPVLEQAYNILNENKDQIEKDIADCEQAIAALKEKNK